MTVGHLEPVLAIEREAFPNPWRRDDFEYALGRLNGYAAVACLSSGPVGYAVGFFVKREFHLANLAIKKELRRRGLGSAFLEGIITCAKDRGAKAITLEVRMSNAPAQALYERAGFSPVAIREKYYSRPREDALVMIKMLTDIPWP